MSKCSFTLNSAALVARHAAGSRKAAQTKLCPYMVITECSTTSFVWLSEYVVRAPPSGGFVELQLLVTGGENVQRHKGAVRNFDR